MNLLCCPKCGGSAVLVEQTGALSCARQCDETPRDELLRKEQDVVSMRRLASLRGEPFACVPIAVRAESGQVAAVLVLRAARDRRQDRFGEGVVTFVQLTGWFYLSFVKETFVGGCIVRAEEMLDAVSVAHELGINPGGEVMGMPIPEGFLPGPEFRERLLSKSDIKSFWADAARLGDIDGDVP